MSDTKKRRDYDAIIKRSMARDFYPEPIIFKTNKVDEMQKQPKIIKRPEKSGDVLIGKNVRIISLPITSSYKGMSRYIENKLMRLKERTGLGTTGWYEFVYDDDRIRLNEAAGWSDNKKRYLLENPKLRES